MKKINEITKGKAKSMFSTENEDHLIMHFSDDTSAFDGKKREALLGKGAVNNQFNAFIMNHLKDNGVESHLIEVIDSTDSLVYKLDMFPIECVIRNRASGSICKRLGTEDGLVLENPLFEFFKFGKKVALQNFIWPSKLLGGEDESLLIFFTIQLLATEIPLSAA